MRIITKREKIKTVACRWYKAYSHMIDSPYDSAKKMVFNFLSMLDLNIATEEQITSIIGNDSWTRLKCDECNKPVDAIIEVGEPMDIESSTARICFNCLRKAYDLTLKEGQND